VDIEKKRAEINWLLFEYGVREDLREDLKKELSSLGVCIVDEECEEYGAYLRMPMEKVHLSGQTAFVDTDVLGVKGFRKVYKLEVSDD
jgi:hypothetical protein